MEQLIARIAKAPLGAKIGVVAGVAVLVTALNYFVLGMPTFGASISDLETKIQRTAVEQRRLDQDYIEKTAIANDLNRFRREKELLEQRLKDALSELPEAKNLDELLALFQDRASKAGIDILTIEPRAQKSEGFYAKIPIPMSVQGNYHEIATFLDAVGRLKRIVNVTDLSLDQPKNQNGRVVLSAKFLATTFMFVESKGGEAPTPKSKSKGGAKR
jgi:type IV pilus assembly protein PilO